MTNPTISKLVKVFEFIGLQKCMRMLLKCRRKKLFLSPNSANIRKKYPFSQAHLLRFRSRWGILRRGLIYRCTKGCKPTPGKIDFVNDRRKFRFKFKSPAPRAHDHIRFYYVTLAAWVRGYMWPLTVLFCEHHLEYSRTLVWVLDFTVRNRSQVDFMEW